MKIIESNLKFRNVLRDRKETSLIVIHNAEASECTIEDIHEWHLGRGWSGCGYHYFIRKDGSIYRGRPENSEGAHCKSFNHKTIGICLEGNYMKEIVPAKQTISLIELCNMLNKKYGKLEIKGHRDLYNTDCPGVKFPLEEIKSLVGKEKGIKDIENEKLKKHLKDLEVAYLEQLDVIQNKEKEIEKLKFTLNKIKNNILEVL